MIGVRNSQKKFIGQKSNLSGLTIGKKLNPYNNNSQLMVKKNDPEQIKENNYNKNTIYMPTNINKSKSEKNYNSLERKK
jgi:hypothetical protein